MASKRMEAQARWGDILIAIGGGEGVLFLANLYHDAGKPVIPVKFETLSGGYRSTSAIQLRPHEHSHSEVIPNKFSN